MEAEVERITGETVSIDSIIRDKIASNPEEKSFYVANMFDIYQKHLKWLRLMPRIKPYYAVKCNNLLEILQFLGSLGTNFDCASKQEIDQVLACGIEPERIIYANPCKTNVFIRHANKVNVRLMTFDNELELHKVAQIHKDAQLVLRIKGDDSSSRCKFNIKFGADLNECKPLLKLAKELGLDVVGVSFHNGSDCLDPIAYKNSISACRQVFELAKEFGYTMRIVDIGGGFPGDQNAKVPFEDIAKVVNEALDEYFPAGSDQQVDIIAEPGRFFVSSSLTLVTMVIAKRLQNDELSGKTGFMYYMNDGVYGAFNNIIHENARPEPELIELDQSCERPLCNSVMWGPTCDSVDCIKRNFEFPELQVGDYVLFRDMGAYTCCAATKFNGFGLAKIIIVDNTSH